jgi:hypothetical protein
MKLVRPLLALLVVMLISGCGDLPGFSPGDIWEAAAKDDVETIKGFMAEGVSVNAVDDAGAMPLHAAARSGDRGDRFSVR